MKETLKKYIIDNYGIDRFQDVINKNYLQYQYVEDVHNVKFLLNKANVILLQNELIKIAKEFNEHGIKYIAFKGAILANRLYDNIFTRFFSDIDVFVFPKHFDNALNLLYKNGYVLRYPNALTGDHHVALRKDKIVLELHKNILNPFTQIDETFLRSNLEIINLSRNCVTTFNKTGTFLHMIYHLYMDSLQTSYNIYKVYTTKFLITAKRFFNRAYEIALFSEKYLKQIKWDEIIKDIENQKLRNIFYIMINNILKIFPEAFPKRFIDRVADIKYFNDERDILYKYIIDFNLLNENINVVLSNFIDSQWNKKAAENLKINSAGRFILDNPIVKNQTIDNNFLLVCVAEIEKIDVGIKLIFRVTNDDFCFSEIDDYNTQTSDGVHLIICGTKKYSFNSIFLFPKVINDKMVALPVNVLNGVNSKIDNSLISTSFHKFESEYIIKIVLKNEFLKINNIEEYFYLGLIISDCSNKMKKRKAELILSKPANEWYNPVHFAKIIL